jgi:hypothetical protein
VFNAGGPAVTTGGADGTGANSGFTVGVSNNTTVTNTGMAAALSGLATALGQNGNNSTTGSITMVAAAGGGSTGAKVASTTSAVNDLLVDAINRALADARSGSATASGVVASTNVSDGGEGPSVTGGAMNGSSSQVVATLAGVATVNAVGNASAGSGAASNTAQIGTNTTSSTIGTVNAAGGASS